MVSLERLNKGDIYFPLLAVTGIFAALQWSFMFVLPMVQVMSGIPSKKSYKLCNL